MLAPIDLEPGEHIIFQGHPSWRSILGFYIKGLAFVVVSAAIAGVATTIANDDFDFEFAGVASPAEVVEAVHRAQREADAPPGRTSR